MCECIYQEIPVQKRRKLRTWFVTVARDLFLRMEGGTGSKGIQIRYANTRGFSRDTEEEPQAYFVFEGKRYYLYRARRVGDGFYKTYEWDYVFHETPTSGVVFRYMKPDRVRAARFEIEKQ